MRSARGENVRIALYLVGHIKIGNPSVCAFFEPLRGALGFLRGALGFWFLENEVY